MSGITRVNGGWCVRGYKGKGGGSPRSPVEAPDSLHSTSYARVLDLLSEGEIQGLVNGLKSVYLNETPVENADGSRNFDGVTFDFRAGTQLQDYIPGFPAAETTTLIGLELRAGTAWTRAVSNRALSAVRITLGVDSLVEVNTSNGDQNGYSVSYAIDLQTAGGAWVEVVNSAFTGKATSPYRRTHRIDLPASTSGWVVRVRRITANSSSSTISDRTVIDSIAEVVDGKLRYPMSALAGLQLDASQFGTTVPTRAYHLRGRVIRVPSNYDPATRSYTGTWDGTFKSAYSNNPAWVFYDILINARYGLGENIPAAWVNKWALYQIGSYCDGMVPDGRGGTEPRFTCNVYLQTAGDAYRVLQDLAGIFRGMTYWAQGSAEPVADMPRDPVYSYTQANVIDGRFNYTGSRRKDRYTVALVSYNDMTDFGRQKAVYVQDEAAVARYGVRKTEISAFGCTSEAQALRLGKWALLTAKEETRAVTFSVGLDGTLVAPGSVIRVADNLLAGKRIGGRIRAATRTVITVDAQTGVQFGDELTVVMPNGISETRQVTRAIGVILTADMTTYRVDSTALTADMISLPGSVIEITVSVPFSQAPVVEGVWALESVALRTQTFTVMSVSEGDGITFDISAVQHAAGKFATVDYGARLEPRPITVVPSRVQPAPNSVLVSSYEVFSQGITSTTVSITWPPVEGAIAYEVEWRRDSSDWVRMARTPTAGVEIENAYSGDYLARVRAINAIEVSSTWTSSVLTNVNGLTAAPPAVTHLVPASLVFGLRLDWGFPSGRNVIERTELWYSASNDRSTAIKLGDFAYPQNTHTMMGLGAGVGFFFWARLVDKNGTVGPWYPAELGVYGQSSSDASEILDYIAGQIDETMLAESLREPIEKIPLLEQQVEVNATAISDEATIREDADSGLAQTISTVSAKTDDNTSAIQQVNTASTERDSALGLRIDTVQASTGDNTALINQVAQASTDRDSALGLRIDTTQAAVGQNTALIQQVNQASVDRDGSLAQSINTVQAEAGDALALSQTVQTALAGTNGALAAMYTIKTQITSGGVPYMAGIGVGVENNQGIITSQILLSAQRVAVINEVDQSTAVPFVVQNGQVFINQAFIANASIGSAKIGDWLESDAVNSAGQRVFRLNMRTGAMEFNGVGNVATRLTLNNNVLEVFENGFRLLRAGVWA